MWLSRKHTESSGTRRGGTEPGSSEGVGAGACPRTDGTSRTGGRRPASPICVRQAGRTRQRTTNNEGDVIAQRQRRFVDSRTVTQRSHSERKHSVERQWHKGITSVGTKPTFLPGRARLVFQSVVGAIASTGPMLGSICVIESHSLPTGSSE